MGAGFTDHGLVFCRPDGGRLHPERCSRMFDREIAKTELPRIRLHGLHADAAALVAGLVSTPLAATGGDGRDQPRDLHG
jgi:hypothetical protein